MARYSVELWYKGQTNIGDIRRMTKNLRFEKKRNGVYSIDFSLDMHQFHRWCDSIGEYPQNVLWPLLTDVRIKCDGVYIIGATVVEMPPNFNLSNATIQVKCDGFLALMGRRMITKKYTSSYTGAIIHDALNVTQAQTNGDLGITFHPDSYMGALSDRTYDYIDQNLQEMIVNRSVYVNDPYDFEFAADRTLRLYRNIGNLRPDVIIEYPAGTGNVPARSMTMTHTGAQIANRIVAYGSGTGEKVLKYPANNLQSQIKYGVIEDTVEYNDVKEPATLIQHAEAELKSRQEALILPSVTVSGRDYPLTEFGIGDVIIARQRKFSLYSMEGRYRVEEMSVAIDDNDNEEISLTLDNVTVWQ